MPSPSPWPLRMLDRLLPDDLRHLTGDLEEEYRRIRRNDGPRRALLRLCWQIARSLPFFMGQTLKWNTVMFTHYLKTGLRVSRKHLSFSLINVVGLAASMAVCLLILLFIVDQKSYDRFHEKSDRIYRVISDYHSPSNQESTIYATSPAGLAEILEESYPGVEEAVTVRAAFSGEIRYGQQYLVLDGLYTSPAFFRVFDFELLQGDPSTALAEPGSIVLTPESARRLIGEGVDPMGKTITAMGDRNYTVTGIVNTDVRTHFRFQSLVSYSTLASNPAFMERLDNWRVGLNDFYTYLLLEEGTADRLSNLLPQVIINHYTDAQNESDMQNFRLQPLTGISLSSAKSNELGLVIPNFIVWFLAGFAGVIILIACFNYVSLTIARAVNRSKEVGVRKVLGAFRSSILKQFLTESVLISLLALLFAFVILNWLLPQFNSLFLINFTSSQIAVDLFSDYWIYGLFLAFSVLVGLLAGLYPAWYFTAYEPAAVLKGTGGGGRSRLRLRKFITVAQFTFSIVFIITTLALVQQFRFMANTDYGFDRERIINVSLQDVPYSRFRDRLGNQPNVEIMAASNKVPALGSINGVWLSSDAITERVRAHHFWVDEHYIEAMGLDLLSGRNFRPELASDSAGVAILGRSAVRALGLDSPAEALGASVTVDEQTATVVGVIDDFISSDPSQAGDPIVVRYRPERFLYAVVKVRPGGTEEFLDALTASWGDLGSSYTLKYEIFDEQLRNNPTVVIFRDFLKVFGMVAFFSVFISCLGLLGMAMYSAENRVKEIGIRKVMGASRQQIILLLSREYLWLIGIAVLIGAPLAWLINSFWLSQVSNSVGLGPLVFVAGLAGTTALALLTVASQTLRAARVKVVDNLRSE